MVAKRKRVTRKSVSVKKGVVAEEKATLDKAEDKLGSAVMKASKCCSGWLKLLVAVAIVILILIMFGGNSNVIKEGSNVTLHYTGTLEDGIVFDSSYDKSPITFVVGEGMVIKGFEDAILGMKKGEQKKFVVLSEDAYGEPDSNKIGSYPRSSIPEDLDVNVGDTIFIQTESGAIGMATILDMNEEIVLLDLNHPLAGKDLTYDVNIVSIE